MNQQQQAQGQQAYMPQPPAIISTKDHLYLEDMLSWNLNAIKKAHFFAQNVQDPDIQRAITQMAQMHQRHYQTLLNHIQQHLQTTQQPAQTNQMGGMQ
ncbi:rubrerythrin [Pullulanibacillus pueri]|uniref:Coat F domain-containing protein n=1 Tax=Pullulanibacillus pueri TaxID=1437324 RepID=A0A8J2ZSC4_9BACL|nr:ferritin-like domain-containing protein [Pullulanibacillus pueri]MBM7680395.1 rubrerythrin [Pullulanibacillus pueri]GGH75284.1 hypothetical protein GCM10007096_04350 [Pullulanibacillus pueri]